jgi:ABC-type phosphate transport system substrate-binding protein
MISVNGISPTNEGLSDYPITKQLYLHTDKKPHEAVREFLLWILKSDQAARITERVGFSLPPSD